MARPKHPLSIAIESRSEPMDFPRTVELLKSEVVGDAMPGESVVANIRVKVKSINDEGKIFGEIQGKEPEKKEVVEKKVEETKGVVGVTPSP